MNSSISILGCGWLGYPFAKLLVDAGWRVKGSTTCSDKIEALRADGVEPYLLALGVDAPVADLSNFLNSSYLLVNVPPSKGLKDLAVYQSLIDAVITSSVKKVLFISSTSVYPIDSGSVDELFTDSLGDESHFLLGIERLFMRQSAFQTTVIRFGGLFGGERNPGGFFKSKRLLQNPDSPVNLIHLDDCLSLMHEVLKQNVWGEVFNGVTDTHPTKREFYSLAAQVAGFAVPEFECGNDSTNYKIVSNTKVKQALGFSFKHDDLLGYLR